MTTRFRVVAFSLVASCGGYPAQTAPAGALRERAVVSQGAADRTIVRTASLTLEVATLDSARARASAALREHGARLDRESASDRRILLRFRVPNDRLDAALTALTGLGKVRSRTSTAEDHSVEAADMDARVKNLEASRDRLRVLAQRAESVTDVVAVERELSRIQGELDSIQAQLRVLRERAALAALDVALEQRVVPGPVGWILYGTGVLIGKLFVWR